MQVPIQLCLIEFYLFFYISLLIYKRIIFKIFFTIQIKSKIRIKTINLNR